MTFATLAAALRSRQELALENLALRVQLASFKSRGRQPLVRPADRLFWILLRQFWSRWSDALVFVSPDTVLRWHRAGFRLYWSWLSRRGRRPGRPPLSQVRALVLQMPRENGWGAPRVHGELLMLGFKVSERTVSRFLRAHRQRIPSRQSWLTFLRNHRDAIAAMDFLVVSTFSFRLLYVLFFIRHGRRQIVHFNVTAHPTAAWVVQQIRDAFPFDSVTKHLILDRDSTFSAEVLRAIKAVGSKPVRTSFHSPWQNGTAERWVGSCRRQLLDHVLVLNEAHLHRLLTDYLRYYHDDRTHCGLGKATPAGRSREPWPSPSAKVTALPRLGGLHHRYTWAPTGLISSTASFMPS